MALLLTALLLMTVLAGAALAAEGDPAQVYDDGRARPSSCGKLQVVNGKLCGEDGEPAILRRFATPPPIPTVGGGF